MLSLGTWICDLVAPDYRRRLGDYVCQTAPGEVLGVTINVKAQPRQIMGAATFSPELLDDKDMLELLIDGREQCPLIASATQRIAIANPESMVIAFRELRECRRGMMAVIPFPTHDRMNLVLAPIKDVRRRLDGVMGAESFSVDTGPTMATLKVHGAKSFCTLAGVVHV